MPIMALFPNLESLSLDRLDSLSDYYARRYITQLERQGDHAATTPLTSIPSTEAVEPKTPRGSKIRRAIVTFPKLKMLNVPLGSAEQWTGSRLLQAWLRTSRCLDHLAVLIRSSVHSTSTMSELIRYLSKDGITLRRVNIHSAFEDNIVQIQKVLSSPLCRALEDINIRAVDFSTLGYFHRPDRLNPRWNPGEQKILAKLFLTASWTKNLTSLTMQSLIDPIVLEEQERGEWGVDQVSTRTLFKMMSNLVALELTDPVMDLSFLEGLGRPPSASFTAPDADASKVAAPFEPSKPFRLQDYCSTERPLLKQLKHIQSNRVFMDEFKPLDKWRTQLLHQFRFLTTFQLTRE